MAAGFGTAALQTDDTPKHTPATRTDQSAHRYVLTIRAGGRVTVWGYYLTHDEADAIGRRLRVHGFDARVADVPEVQP